jgi:LL-diaminopimelate aminotransferase
MKFAERVGQVPEYLFVQITRKIAEKRAQGIEVVSFGIGDPDLPTPDHVLDALQEAARAPDNHRYPESEGLPEYRQAVANWYHRRFAVSLDPETEVTSLVGGKEGIGHASLCFIDPGTTALVPDPGYPVYSAGTIFAGGVPYRMPLKEENGWLPDLGTIPAHIADEARLMWINYPNNPTGAVAGIDFFERVVEFASKHDIAVMHDACYTEVAYDGFRPVSFLQTHGAMDLGIEFHSLSKTFNMTGWRLGMAVGNAEIISRLRTVKSNLDSGVPQAIQHMGIAALNAPLDSIDGQIATYQRRRDKVVKALQRTRLRVQPPRAGLYVWAKVPEGYTSAQLAGLLLDKRDILVSPGSGYGDYGEGYIRLSLTISDENLEKGLDRLKSWKVPSPKSKAPR